MIEINSDWFKVWLKNKGLKDNTINNYFAGYIHYGDKLFNQENTNKFLSEFNNGVRRAFLKQIQEALLVNADELNISQDRFIEISKVKIPKQTGTKLQKIVRPLTDRQIQLLESNLETEPFKLMLLVSYHCGLRQAELTSLTINSFNWSTWKQTPEAMGELIIMGKGSKEDIALVPNWLMKRVANYINNNLKGFQNLGSSLFNISGRTWYNYLSTAGVKSGITALDEFGKPIINTIVHPHRLRHSYASNLLKRGIDLRYVQEAMRHKSIQSTQIYTHIGKDELKAKLEEAGTNS